MKQCASWPLGLQHRVRRKFTLHVAGGTPSAPWKMGDEKVHLWWKPGAALGLLPTSSTPPEWRKQKRTCCPATYTTKLSLQYSQGDTGRRTLQQNWMKLVRGWKPWFPNLPKRDRTQSNGNSSELQAGSMLFYYHPRLSQVYAFVQEKKCKGMIITAQYIRVEKENPFKHTSIGEWSAPVHRM